MIPYGDMDVSHYWLRQWLVAWRHQAITWTNVDWSQVLCNIRVKAVSQEFHINLILNLCSEIAL